MNFKRWKFFLQFPTNHFAEFLSLLCGNKFACKKTVLKPYIFSGQVTPGQDIGRDV